MSTVLKLLVVRDDNIPAFGAYHLPPAGEPKDRGHVVLLNCEAHFGDLVDEVGQPIESTSEERKRTIIETIMHEFGHALEAHFDLPDNEEAIEAAIASYQPGNFRAPNSQVPTMKNTVTRDQIDALMANSQVDVCTKFDKVTVVTVKLPNGFVLVEASGAVDKANYSEAQGAKICLDRIATKLWQFEGYQLSTRLDEQRRNTPGDDAINA